MHINIHDIDDLLTTGAPIHTINEHLADGHHTLTYKALTCKYHRDSSQAGSSRSICALTALNCVRLAFQLEAEQGHEGTILPSFVSEEMVHRVMNIVNYLSFDTHLEIDGLLGLLDVPIFKETVISNFREQVHYHSPETFKALLIQLFPPESLKPIIAVVFTQTPEHLVCLRFQSSGSHIFAIFDPHSRSEHPFGPAFILASDVDTIVTRFNQLLTQPSVSQPATSQDITAKRHSFRTLVIESRENSSTVNITDLLTRSVAYLSEKFSAADHIPSTLDTGVLNDHLDRLRIRAESLRTQKLAHATFKQDNNQQSGHARPSIPARNSDAVLPSKQTRRSEFGWQLNLQASGVPSATDPKDNRDPSLAEFHNSLEIKKTSTMDIRKKNEFDWLASLIPGPEPNVDIPPSNTSKSGKKDATLSHMRSRTDFGWQMALQKKDTRELEGGKESETMTSTVVSQAGVQTHRVLLGKEKKEAFGGVSAKQTFWNESESAWQDILAKQLQEKEELVASSSRHRDPEGTWILALQKRIRAEEEKIDNAVASSSSSPSHAKFGLYQYDLDLKALPLTEAETSTIHRDPHHSSIFTNYLDAVQRCKKGFTTLEIPASEFPAESHECGVCNELYGMAQIIQLPTCAHTFCRECLRTFTKTKIIEGRYPIFCPVCAIQRTRVNQSHITQAIVEKLELSKQDLEKLNALQLIAHSVTLHCPKCKQTMNVDRGEYANQRTIICPLPACRHKWCKECLKPLASSQTEHNCKQHGFERLMRRKGWKYCPGCNTPVQKETGCNHMTCGSPGCNVHFCYKCGISIIDTSNGGDVGSAVTEHYINCVMFEKRRRCIIQ